MLKFKGYEFQPMDSVLTNQCFHLTNKWEAFAGVIVKQIKENHVKKAKAFIKEKSDFQ